MLQKSQGVILHYTFKFFFLCLILKEPVLEGSRSTHERIAAMGFNLLYCDIIL